jgi:tetratricopeptide (TPR) repeat protein
MVNKLTFPLFLGVALVALAGCDSPEEKHEKYIERGDAYMKEYDYVHARLEYKNAAKINPTNPKVIYSLGLVEEAQGNLHAALSAFMTAEQQDKNFEPVVQKLAEFFLTAQQDEEAMIRIHRLLTINPDNSMGHALYASLLLKRKEFAAAEKEVARALELDKKNIIAYSVRSGLHVAKKEHGDAINVLDEGIKQNPDDVSLYLLKAVIYADQDDIENVRKIYEEIFKMNPDKINYRLDLAQILSTSKDPASAEEVLRAAVEKFPENEDAKRRLITLLEQERGMQSAEAEIKTLIQKSPEQKTLYLWLAELYIRNKHEDMAIAALENILEAPSDEWVGLTANTSMARIKLSQGDMDLAKKLIDIVLSKDVNNGDALLLRANLALSQGDYDQSLGDVRNVIRDNPKSPQAARLLTEILVFQGRQDLAIDTLLQYHALMPEDLGAQVRLAQLYAMKGDVKQSFDILTKIAENDPSFAVTWETLARLAIQNKLFDRAEESITHLAESPNQEAAVLFLKGQLHAAKDEKDAALEAYKQILEQYPNSPLVDHALSGMLAITSGPDGFAALETFLKETPTQNPSVTSVLGGVQAELGKTEEAIATLNLALTQKPQSQGPYLSLAELLKKNNRMDEALSVLEQAEKDLPFEPKASLMRADILVAQGDAGKAVRLYEDLLEKNKGSQMADVIANNLAQTIADHQGDDSAQLEKARLIAERFINSDNPYYLDTLGWVYYKQGNLAAAEPLLKKAKSLLKTPNEQIDEHYREVTGAAHN